jgi:ActR/RegA family two-component response regulator
MSLKRSTSSGKAVTRLLLVDDYQPALNTWARECRRVGKQPLMATTHAKAIAATRESKPEAAIVDLFLGAGNGIALVNRLKEIAADMFIAVASAIG